VDPLITRYFVCGGENLDPDPTVHTGDVTTCEAAGLAGTIHASGELPPGDVSAPDSGSPTTGATVDVNQDPGPLQGRELSVLVENDHTMSGIVVAGGGAYHLYTGPFVGPVFMTHLTAPLAGQDPPIIEHYFVCGSPTPTTTPSLPATGNTPTSTTMVGLVSAGAALVAVGVTLLLFVRRRRSTTTA
jgi:hypothetical protein